MVTIMKCDESIEINNIIINSNQILIKKRKKTIIIEIENIISMNYGDNDFFNWLAPEFTHPGYLEIRYKNENGKQRLTYVKMKYSDLKKIPEKILRKFYIS